MIGTEDSAGLLPAVELSEKPQPAMAQIADYYCGQDEDSGAGV